MATTVADLPPARHRAPFAPDTFERVLAVGAVLLLAAVAAALVRGHARWGLVPGPIWAHLLTIVVALALTPTMLLRARGTRSHRMLGWVWSGAMLSTAAISFAIHATNPGGYSPIHILSGGTLVLVPVIVWTARTHQVARHRRAVRGMVLGALLIAGAFTFPFHRLMGTWLFG